jgi:hypothetical protein
MSPGSAGLTYGRRRPRAPTEDDPQADRPLSQAHANALPATTAAGWTRAQVRALQRRAGNRVTVRAVEGAATDRRLSYMSETHARNAAVMRWPLRRHLSDAVRRMSIPNTATTDPDWDRVPAEHRARVQAAIGIIDTKVTSRQLINYFRNHAPGGTANTLQQVANRARVWELRAEGGMGLSVVGGNDMAYDTGVYRIGRWQIAATLLHEMGHLARFPTEAECENTMDAANTYAPLIRRVRPRSAAPGDTVTISGISFGPSQESTDRVTLNGIDVGPALIWRWQHAGQGQIRFRVPQEASSGPLVVENNRVSSNAVQFTVTPAADEAEAPAPAAAAAPAPVPAPTAPVAETGD